MDAPYSLEPLFLLHDEPIAGDEDNFFAPDSFATTIARAALGTKGPFTIGVYGDWGSGKTSSLHAAKHMIDRCSAWSHVVTVEFNAWRYEREDHPIVPLVATIEKALEEKLKQRATLIAQGKEFAATSFMFMWQVIVSFLAASKLKLGGETGIPLVAKGKADVEFDGGKFVERVENAFDTATVAKETIWTQIRDAAIYYSVFEQLSALHVAASNMGGEDLEKFPRVIVFIDDLDRCQADKAFVLLENVKLVLSQPGFVFVLALNERVVRTYLDHLAVARYGEKNIALHKSYLDKIVQLPLHMPPRGERFERFAEQLLDRRLAKASGTEAIAELKKLAKVLARSANQTPRSLVRRINTTMVDIALRDGETLPASLKNEAHPFPIFSGLCIVQRTLEASIGAELTRDLARDQELCSLLLEKGIFGALDALKPRTEQSLPPFVLTGKAESKPPPTSGEAPRKIADPRINDRWKAIVEALYDAPFLYRENQKDDGAAISGTSLLTSVEGKRWLSNSAERMAIMRIAYQRPDEVISSTTVGGTQTITGPAAVVFTTLGEPRTSAEMSAIVKEHALIERKIRQTLNLPADAPLGPAEFCRVTDLSFTREPITDTGMAWLADPNTGFKALVHLGLAGTAVTDAGLRELARTDTGLNALETLNLMTTAVTDVGIKELTRPDTGLKTLLLLDLGDTDVTDAGLRELARADSGLKALYSLDLHDTMVGDEGLKEIARADTGLKALHMLNLRRTKVTDVGLKEIARPESGLRSIISLFISDTPVTDIGLGELAREDCGIKQLQQLDLARTKVTAEGISALQRARPSLAIGR